MKPVDDHSYLYSLDAAPAGGVKISIGVISGTSCDGLDIAVLQTDGGSDIRVIEEAGFPFSDRLRNDLIVAGKRAKTIGDASATDDETVKRAEADFTAFSAEVLKDFVRRYQPDVIGFHGQTVLHLPESGISMQIGDANFLAETLNTDIVCHFRAADVKAGGQGAPLASLYHAALLKTKREILPSPAVWTNVGGVANITFCEFFENSDHLRIISCDTGPGNGLSDLLTLRHFGVHYDHDGQIAFSGILREDLLEKALAHPYFIKAAPKSLDRNDFNIDMFEGVEPADAIATAIAISAHALVKTDALLPAEPKVRVVSGGGAHNPYFMHLLKTISDVPVLSSSQIGFSADFLEAECFAWLAVRSLYGLPLSLPGTTGVSEPLTGGEIIHAGDRRKATA
jgi:anhydro-N-acetylmuramic acid kinase